MRFRWISLLVAVMMITAVFSTVTGFADDENTLSQQTASQGSETIADDDLLTADDVDAPDNVRARGISKSKIKVSWDSVDNADGYKVYRYNKSKGRYTCIKTITDEDKCSYTNTGLDTNTKKTYKVSAYALSDNDGFVESDGTTASGKKAAKGVIAVDPRVIKLGTKVYVPGYGYATAADTGGMIKGNIIDVYMNTNSQCIKWGVRYITIKVYD